MRQYLEQLHESTQLTSAFERVCPVWYQRFAKGLTIYADDLDRTSMCLMAEAYGWNSSWTTGSKNFCTDCWNFYFGSIHLKNPNLRTETMERAEEFCQHFEEKHYAKVRSE